MLQHIALEYQINPAVTIALLVTGKIRAKEAPLYIACQILGAVLGAAVVYSMFGGAMAPKSHTSCR